MMFRKFFKVTLIALSAIMPFSLMANDELLVKQRNSAEWVFQLGNYAGQRYSDLAHINRSNVGNLVPVWTMSTGVLRGHEGGPLVIGSTMYIHTPFPNKVMSLDLDRDGAINWIYEPKQDPSVIGIMCCDTVNRGVSYAEGKIFLHQADTTLVALNANTGEVIWSVKNGNPDIAETGTSNPLVIKDKIIVGVSGGEYGVRGHLTAYNINTGERVWRAYSVGPDTETLIEAGVTTELGKPVKKDEGVTTWEGDQWKIGGGTTWGWITYDTEEDLLYYSSGNPGTWNPSQRPGDNKWSMTIFARNPDTGMAKWVYQMTPHDEWDYDGVNESILADIRVKGKMTKALVHFDRNGFGYTMDRVTGELLVAEKFDPAVNWATHVDMKTGRPQVVSKYSPRQNGEDFNTEGICPAALGSKDQQPASFSPKTGLFYVPTNHVCMNYEPYNVSYTAGQAYVGATLTMFPPDGDNHLGNLIAWDASNGKIVWSNPEPFSVWSGVLSTAGDVVFYGTLEGYLKAVDAKSGAQLYQYKTPSGIIGNVTTYMHRGKQYIAVYSGLGGWAGIGFAAGLTKDTDGLGAVGAYKSLSNYTQLGGVLTVFALR